MPPTNEELSWWHEVISWGWAIIAGVVTATSLVVWRTRGIIAAQEALAEGQKLLAKNHYDLVSRVMEIEAADREMISHCAAQRKDILENLRKEVCTILTTSLQEDRIKTSDERVLVTTTLALHTQALENIEKDIKGIFLRLDRRHIDSYVPLGRREADYAE